MHVSRMFVILGTVGVNVVEGRAEKGKQKYHAQRSGADSTHRCPQCTTIPSRTAIPMVLFK